MKSKNAISLIVLVITILVLSILATVTIIVIGNSDIIARTRKTKDEHNETVILERLNLATMGVFAKKKTDLSDEDIENALRDEFGEGNYAYLGEGVVQIDEKYYKVQSNGSAKEATIKEEYMGQSSQFSIVAEAVQRENNFDNFNFGFSTTKSTELNTISIANTSTNNYNNTRLFSVEFIY